MPRLPSSTTASICVQTELTMEDIMILEEDNQHRIDELAKLKKDMPKAYPSVYDFKENKKLLRFYTGLGSFTVLIFVALQAFVIFCFLKCYKTCRM